LALDLGLVKAADGYQPVAFEMPTDVAGRGAGRIHPIVRVADRGGGDHVSQYRQGRFADVLE
jgi:hypothetical protein